MIVTVASPVAADAIAQAITQTSGAHVEVCGLADVAIRAPHGDALVIPGLWYTPAISAALATPSSKCRWVQFLSAGYDRLDETQRPPGVHFSRVVGVWGAVTAEHAIALLLGLTRRIPDAVAAQAAREWRDSLRPTMNTLDGASIAIIGTGEVGAAIALRLTGFGAEIVGVSRSATLQPAFDRMIAMDRIDAHLATFDVLIVAVPYTRETHHLVDKTFLARLKHGVFLINVSRGSIVDQRALEIALRSGQIAGAAIDVTDPEPLPAEDPLWSAPNLLITPHIGGGAPSRFYDKLAAYVAHNCAAWIVGGQLNGSIT